MSWVTPPTFSDGETLSATKLNQLSDGVTFLNGLGGQATAMNLSAAGGDYFCPRHKQRYLQVRYYGSGSDYIKVYYNGGIIFQDGTPDDGENWLLDGGTTVLDLDSVGGFVAYGQPYVLTIQVAGGTTIIRMVTESNTSSI